MLNVVEVWTALPLKYDMVEREGEVNAQWLLISVKKLNGMFAYPLNQPDKHE